MAGNSAKKPSEKAPEPSVLGSLPSTRPARLGRARPAAEETRATKPRPKPRAAATRSKPRAAAKPKAAPPPPPPEPDRRRTGPPSGIDLVATGVRATGEIARLGLAVGAHVVKRAAARLPRP